MPALDHAVSLPMCELLRVSVIHEQTYPGSKSYRVTTADGSTYIMKVFPVEVARMLSFREVFANELGIRLGFSMAHWRVLQLDDQTQHDHVDKNTSPELDRALPRKGYYFGTRIAEGLGSLRMYLSDALLRANSEVARQLGCIRIFDVWLAHAGFRQFAAVMQDRRPAFVYFFSNAQALNPENPKFFEYRASVAYNEACKLAGSSRLVNEFLDGIRKQTEGDLRNVVYAVPGIWRDPAWEIKAVLMLRSRQNRLLALWRAGFSSKTPECSLPTSLLSSAYSVNITRTQAQSV